MLEPIPFRPGLVAGLLAMITLFPACGGHSVIEAHQGIYGTYTHYYLPPAEPCEQNYATQEDRDNCRHRNQTRIVEPMKGLVSVIRNDDGSVQEIPLGGDGGYRVNLKPGYYTVCLGKQCSDAIEVRLQKFVAWGGHFPREGAEETPKAEAGGKIHPPAALPTPTGEPSAALDTSAATESKP